MTGSFRADRQIVCELIEAKTPRVLRDLLNAYFVELGILDRDLPWAQPVFGQGSYALGVIVRPTQCSA
jgi:hypothetical protein